MSKNIIIFGLFFFTLVYGFSLGPVIWLYLPEIVEPRKVPWTTAMNWIGSATVVILFPAITDNYLHKNPWPFYVFFAIYNFIATAINKVYLVETKDKSDKQIK